MTGGPPDKHDAPYPKDPNVEYEDMTLDELIDELWTEGMHKDCRASVVGKVTQALRETMAQFEIEMALRNAQERFSEIRDEICEILRGGG